MTGCTGVKIAPRHYLTAAHCLWRIDYTQNALGVTIAQRSSREIISEDSTPINLGYNHSGRRIQSRSSVSEDLRSITAIYIPEIIQEAGFPFQFSRRSRRFAEDDYAIFVINHEIDHIPSAIISNFTPARNSTVFFPGYGADNNGHNGYLYVGSQQISRVDDHFIRIRNSRRNRAITDLGDSGGGLFTVDQYGQQYLQGIAVLLHHGLRSRSRRHRGYITAKYLRIDQIREFIYSVYNQTEGPFWELRIIEDTEHHITEYIDIGVQ